MTRKWAVYLDESGNYDADVTQHTTVLAGVLLEVGARDINQADDTLREAIEEAVPEVPWPPHATAMKQDILWVLWLYMHERLDFDPVLKPLLERHLSALTPLQREKLAHSLALKKEPTGELRHALRLELAHEHPALYAQLKALALRRRARYRRAIKDAAVHHAVAITEDHIEGAAPSPYDRYTTQLLAMFEHLQDVLLAMPGEHELDIFVANRHVAHLEEQGKTMLDEAYCQHIFDQVDHASWQQRERLTHVRFWPWKYGSPDTPAHMVLADTIANPLRARLKNLDTQAFHHDFKLSLTHPERPLMLAATTGRLHEERAMLRHGGCVETPAPTGALPTWMQRSHQGWSAYFLSRGTTT